MPPPEKSADDEDLWKVPTRAQPAPEETGKPAGKERSLRAASASPRSSVPLAALAALGLAHVLPALFSGRVWARNDYGSSVVPAFATLKGHVPFVGAPSWAPHVFGGTPQEVLAAMPRYPLNLFAYLLDPAPAAALFVGLHLALAAITSFLFIRRVAGTTRAAALFGAMVYAFGGALWLRGMHPDYLAVAAWMPAVLRSTWDLCTAESRERRKLFASLLAITTGLALLVGGGAPIVMLTAIAALAMIADGIGQRAKTGVPRIAALREAAPFLAAGVGAGLLIAAPGLLPFLEVILDGARRSLTLEESSAFALRPPGFGRIVVPELGARWPWPAQVEPWVYFGVLTLPLALLAALRDARGRTLALWAAVALLASLGTLGGLHQVLYHLLPGYSLLRAPGRWTIVAGLAVGGLAARGIDALLSDTGTRRSAWILAGATGLAGAVALVAPAGDPLVRRGLVFLGVNALFATAWLAGAARAAGLLGQPRHRFVAAAAAVMLAADLAGIVLRMPVDDSPAALDPPPVLAQAAGATGGARVFHDDSAGPRPLDNGNRWRYRNARGYSQVVPASFSTLLDLGATPDVRFTGWPERLDPRLLRLLGVGVYVGSDRAPPPPGFAMKPFVSDGGLAAWKALEPPFETAVVSEVVVAPSRELEASSAISIDTTRVAVVAEDVGLPTRAPGTKSEPAGAATLERLAGGALVARVTASRDALLVVGEGHHRRWEARAGRAAPDGTIAGGGERLPVVRADAIWMGVRVPAGKTDVVFRCRPAVRWWMWLFSVCGLGLATWVIPPGRKSLRSA